jgi:hypothetical protein
MPEINVNKTIYVPTIWTELLGNLFFYNIQEFG